MLQRIEINNLAVIAHCVFEPSKGLNVLTGETGAGKSLLIDAIGLILGDKASKNLVRTGCEKAYIEAVFGLEDVKDEVRVQISKTLEDNGISYDPDSVIVTREISADGRSVARINGRTCILSVLSGVSSLLIDIHGQNDTQKIFNESTHIELLDRFIGNDVFNLLSKYRNELQKYKETIVEIRKLGSSPEAMKQRREYLDYCVREIREAAFKDGEEEQLSEDKKRYSNSSKISLLLERSDALMSSNEGAVSALNESSSLLNKASELDDSYSDLAKRLESLYMEIEALSSELHGKVEDLEYSDGLLDAVDSRINLLFDLKVKYGNSIGEINTYADNAEIEIAEIDNSGDRLAELKKVRLASEAELLKICNLLSAVRHKKAEELKSRIISELNDLEMPNCVFEVEFNEHPKERFFSAYGTENIRFLLSANRGESPKPLSKIASGGEASRIMLAIKNILSEADDTSTLIFDEIDTGISGVAALQVASKLQSISRSHQVLCVTHTAQLAAAGSDNFFIRKVSDDDSTRTAIAHLGSEEKVKEVSRLLSGTADDDSLKLAQNLIDKFKA